MADEVAFADVADHLGDYVGVEGRGVDLSVADGSVVGYEFHEDEVPSTEWRRWICDHERFKRVDYSTDSPPGSPTATAGVRRDAHKTSSIGVVAWMSWKS